MSADPARPWPSDGSILRCSDLSHLDDRLLADIGLERVGVTEHTYALARNDPLTRSPPLIRFLVAAKTLALLGAR